MGSKSSSKEEIAALFKLPLKEFTSARDALAARLKRAGSSAEAAEVKALVKPTLSAWVVNQLYWGERQRFDELLAAVVELRAAQRSRADLRAPLETRRQALAALTRAANARVREAGGNPAPELLRRVAGTLEALATLGGTPGQLSRDLDPPGFEALAGFPRAVAAPARGGSKGSKVLPFARPSAKGERRGGADGDRERERRAAEEARTAARRAVQEAEAELRAAQANAKRASAAAAAALEGEQAARLEKEKLERLLGEATTAAKAQAAEARKLERESKSASAAVVEAERRLQGARQELGD